MPVIAVLPLDDRPCTYDFPARIGAIGGAEVRLPPREWLGNLERPADRDKLAGWLLEVAGECDALVVAIDTLAYGGLIPSRRSPDTLADLMHHVRALTQIKDRHPQLPIFGFSVTMRLSNSDVNEEEKPYWDRYGKLIYRWSYFQHRHKAKGDEEDRRASVEARKQIPAEILEDYLETRQRNLTLNETMVRWAGAEFFTALMLTQDDTSEFGLNVEEQEHLKQMVETTRITDRVLIYPGADEVASVLVARALNHLAGRAPTMAASWHPLDSKRLVAMYEDRPLWQTLRGQIKAAGGKEIGDEAAADGVIVINLPAESQGDLALRYRLEGPDTPPRNLEPLLLTLEGRQGATAFADVAYANGCDPRLLPELVGRVDPWTLSGFGGWNTAGNTFGTVVATLSCATLPGADRQALERFITERLADDWLYQSVIRPELQKLKAEGADMAALKEALDRRLGELWSAHFPSRPARFRTHFPWNRLFEAGIFTE